MSNNNQASDRIVWAVAVLDIQPDDEVLEIGCGHGVAVTLICDKLETGHILAIDRSSKMIAMASKRNAMSIDVGKASFQTVGLREANFENRQFDKIFAIRVGIFLRGNPSNELHVIKTCLANEGRFYLMYDPMDSGEADGLIRHASSRLTESGFLVHEVRTEDVGESTVICIVAKTE